MSLDFFHMKCQYPALNSREFGLCDDQNGGKAYIDTGDKSKWIATVKNSIPLDIVFTAVDKCVLFDNEHIGRGRCDGMLTTNEHLFLVELKNQEPPWQSHAIDQLSSTIQFLLDSHKEDIAHLKKRKAFASNKKRDTFVVIDNERNREFYRRTTFRIDVQAEIIIL
jgi:hypothetical protein